MQKQTRGHRVPNSEAAALPSVRQLPLQRTPRPGWSCPPRTVSLFPLPPRRDISPLSHGSHLPTAPTAPASSRTLFLGADKRKTSAPACVEPCYLREILRLNSQIVDFFLFPPSRPGSCILSLFQSRSRPAAWRRQGPPGPHGCQLSGSGQAGPPTSCPPPRLRAGCERGREQRSPAGGQGREESPVSPSSAPNLGVQWTWLEAARPPVFSY